MTPLRSLGACALAIALFPSAVAGQTQFVERAKAIGLDFETTPGLDRIGSLPHMLDWVQTGGAMGDLNGDGTPDLILCGRFNGNRLYLNQGGRFVDATAGSGVQTEDLDNCVTLGDYDGDGDLDAFFGVHGPREGVAPSHDRLCRNDGQAHFEEMVGALDTTGGGHTIFAKFFDLDYDGDLDLYSCQFNGTPNQLHVNNGDGTFTERGAALGADIGGSTHVAGIADVDNDGYVDILIGSDFMVTAAAQIDNNIDDVHLHNSGDGHFTDVTVGAGYDLFAGNSATTMGLSFGDVNYDGLLDVYRTEWSEQILTLNNGWPTGGPWAQVQGPYGVDVPKVPHHQIPGGFGPTVGWGTRFLHSDHDLWLDLFLVAGHVSKQDPRDQRNFMFHGLGPSQQFHFGDVTQAVGLFDEIDDRGLIVGDPDQDGDLDLIITPMVGDLRYFENDASESSDGWIKVYVETHTSAPGGFGSLVSFVDSNGYLHVTPISADGSTASHNESVAHFGLGQEAAVDLTVEFPSGMQKTLRNVKPNQTLKAVEPKMIELSSTKLLSQAVGGTERLWVRALAHDQYGIELDGSAQVTIEVLGLTPMGPVTHAGGNEFRRQFAPAAVAGEHRVEVSFDGWSPRIRPNVAFLGNVSADESTVLLTPDCVRAGSSDEFSAYVTPRDKNGMTIGPGLAVYGYLPGPGGIPPTKLQDMGDGRYRATFSAPQQDGKLRPLFGVIGLTGPVVLNSAATLDSALALEPGMTAFYEEVPQVDFAASPNQLKFMITPEDLNGVRLGTVATATLDVTPYAWSEPVILRADLSAALDSGDYVFVLERPLGSLPFTGSGDVQLKLDGVQVYTHPFSF